MPSILAAMLCINQKMELLAWKAWSHIIHLLPWAWSGAKRGKVRKKYTRLVNTFNTFHEPIKIWTKYNNLHHGEYISRFMVRPKFNKKKSGPWCANGTRSNRHGTWQNMINRSTRERPCRVHANANYGIYISSLELHRLWRAIIQFFLDKNWPNIVPVL